MIDLDYSMNYSQDLLKGINRNLPLSKFEEHKRKALTQHAINHYAEEILDRCLAHSFDEGGRGTMIDITDFAEEIIQRQHLTEPSKVPVVYYDDGSCSIKRKPVIGIKQAYEALVNYIIRANKNSKKWQLRLEIDESNPANQSKLRQHEVFLLSIKEGINKNEKN